jgi:two-component system, NarL family, nitrate/nitrite response regulator NarL
MEPNAASRKIRVLVADSSRIHSQLLASVLQQDPDLVSISWDGSSSGLLSAVVSQNVDILAISSSFGGHAAAGLKIVRDLRCLHPQTKVVVLLDPQEAPLVTDAFRAGARGVFNRDGSVEMFCKCIHSVDRGEIWADNRGISLAVDALASIPIIRTIDFGGLNLLSKREFEVVQCVVQGMTNREIAERLRLSQHTVKNYLFRVFDKLGVSSRVELLFITLGPSNEAMSRRSEPMAFSNALQEMLEGGTHKASAVPLLEKAADQGIPGAQLLLAQALAEGDDPSQSVDAYMWFLIAAEEGRQTRMQLAKKLSPKQIEHAQRKAGNWLARAKPPDSAVSSTTLVPARTDATTAQVAGSITQPAAPSSATQTARRPEPQATPPNERVLSYGSA